MKGLVRVALIVAAGSLLSGCLVSQTAILDASNASATPIAAGVYNACADPKEGEADDCNLLTVSMDDDARYVLSVEDDEIEARFLRIDADDYAIEMFDEDDDHRQYFWGRASDAGFRFVMMWCSDLPRALVDSLVEKGAMAVEDDYRVCRVKTLDALVAAAKSYASGRTVSEGGLVLTRAGAGE
ncbi:MAG: hypothetical protein R3C42_06405 [Parvularculaceae bacterium]|nr:hypothetical protein [Parvularculaceae bacterium]